MGIEGERAAIRPSGEAVVKVPVPLAVVVDSRAAEDSKVVVVVDSVAAAEAGAEGSSLPVLWN